LPRVSNVTASLRSGSGLSESGRAVLLAQRRQPALRVHAGLQGALVAGLGPGERGPDLKRPAASRSGSPSSFIWRKGAEVTLHGVAPAVENVRDLANRAALLVQPPDTRSPPRHFGGL
jgi:hypothetical protein